MTLYGFTLLTLLLAPSVVAAQVTTAAERAEAWRQNQSLAEASPFRGLAWRAVGPVKIGARVEAIAIPVGNKATIYAGVGTGEAQPRYAGYAYPGSGVFKSTDAGESWTAMGLTETHHIANVLIHPTDPDIVFVAALGHQWSANSGICR